MKWERVAENGEMTMADEGLEADPFALLHDKDGASVSFNVGRAHPDFSRVKCSVSVTLRCPQAEQLINKAAELAFKKALELVNDGMSHLAPELPVIEYKP